MLTVQLHRFVPHADIDLSVVFIYLFIVNYWANPNLAQDHEGVKPSEGRNHSINYTRDQIANLLETTTPRQGVRALCVCEWF